MTLIENDGGPDGPPVIVARHQMHATHEIRAAMGAFSFECVRCGHANFPGNEALKEPCPVSVTEGADNGAA